jgi:cytosine/adenosine deaminase-related metal-dependent hydrolase
MALGFPWHPLPRRSPREAAGKRFRGWEPARITRQRSRLRRHTPIVVLLRRAREKADQLDLPMATHAAYSVLEFYDVMQRYHRTPIEILDSVGMLRPTLNIGHGNFIADNPNLNYSGGRDLEKTIGIVEVAALAASTASVSP